MFRIFFYLYNMSKVLAIDYGTRKTGLAISDVLRLIASPLETVETQKLLPFVSQLIHAEKIDTVVVGLPKKLNNEIGNLEVEIQEFIQMLQSTFPHIAIVRIDERFTSKLAEQTLLMSGVKKKKRQDKTLVDNISAAIILQSFLYQ